MCVSIITLSLHVLLCSMFNFHNVIMNGHDTTSKVKVRTVFAPEVKEWPQPLNMKNRNTYLGDTNGGGMWWIMGNVYTMTVKGLAQS